MSARTRRIALGLPVAALGACGYVGGLAALYIGSGRVMREGGYCASGGPYVISHPCPSGTGALIGGGIGAALVLGAVLAFAIGYLGGPAIEAALVLWSAGFATMAVAFFLHGSGGGATVAGGTFVLVALLGVVPLLSSIHDALRGSRTPPSSELVLGEVVRAAGRRPPP
jgi:hypothetical protein